ncbi:XTP/dITP diphosphatase [Aeropyrum camini]|uniref:dITP/XTP pyrophosphatase n=1 Tax=Aeropyrum camini SY1 = JCM 12091 TaxID=1198449 RepID=U3TFW1_9CREN|nr:XTP/dITP diphosphatase [Aeropyrum camini]BAN90194.1 deoxyribonucleotide triphosphate [Aeropyrum camini SY1 = JCM 12091]
MARRILLVTGNRGKLEEAREVLGEYGVEVEQAQAWKLEVQSESLEEIALQAARIAYAQLRRPLAVEDAGLFINALNGFPGPYSSYAYKTIGIPGVLRLLEGAADRRGCFRAAVAYIAPLVERVFTGEVCGSIAREPRGSQGFGFDPIFIPEGYTRTFAELGPGVKNRISHRARAFRRLGEWLSRRDPL